MTLVVGNMVTFSSSPGIGRVAKVDRGKVAVEYFESAAEPVVDVVWRNIAEVRRVRLGEQTRVYFYGAGKWRSGRVVGGDGLSEYYVRVPNHPRDIDIAEGNLRVRWEKAPRDPLQVLLSGANESPLLRDSREAVRKLLLAERAATASATGIMSAGVKIHSHQISAALRIIRDPVQRYLLADEVGMGKTIQAGLVMRQLLIDDPARRIGIIVPDALVAQWNSELLGKFYLDDFCDENGDLPFRILSHSASSQWRELKDVDLLVVDEAHLLTRVSRQTDSPYVELAEVAHAAPRVLMLSATPFSNSATTHLALLHLLDPQLFRWESESEFAKLLDARHQLALAVFGLDEEPDVDNPELLELQFEEIRQLLPNDDTLHDAMAHAVSLIRAGDGDPSAVDLEAVKNSMLAVRTHISETYRLHHRVIRNRRHSVEKQRLDDEGFLTPFEFTGRVRAKLLRLDSVEATAGANAIADWVGRCAAEILDEGLDPVPFGRVLGELVSRLGGPVHDFRSALEYRVNGANKGGLLSEDTEILDSAPILGFESRILSELESVPSDAVEAISDVVIKQTRPEGLTIVFCGRGTLARDLYEALRERNLRPFGHFGQQTVEEREDATRNWRTAGGALVVDETGDVGRNFQDADCVFHVRLPADPNNLEQRIGRVDRYGRSGSAVQYVLSDNDPGGLHTAWAKILARGFEIFSESISTLQEVVEDLARDLWTTVLTEGIEGFLGREGSIIEELRRERRRVNELDALESSYGTRADSDAMALAIGRYEEDSVAIAEAFTKLIVSAAGFRLAHRSNDDGSVTFESGREDRPLLSPRLQGRLDTPKATRSGFFDRWEAVETPYRRLFRRGNPFIDGLENLLAIDDRGQAVALWRLNQRWQNEPMIYFGFDFLIEADLSPMLQLLGGRPDVEPIARRRADAALTPQRRRVWIPAHTLVPVDDPEFAGYLSLPYRKGPDQNLSPKRIGALHSLLGGEGNLDSVAASCFAVARKHVELVADVAGVGRVAVDQIRRETGIVVAQSRARSKAEGLVADPTSLEDEVDIGRAIEAGVAEPTIGLSGVSCVVISAKSWADYV